VYSKNYFLFKSAFEELKHLALEQYENGEK